MDFVSFKCPTKSGCYTHNYRSRCFIILTIITILIFDSYDLDRREPWCFWLKILIPAAILSMLIGAAIPNERQMYVIIGGYAATNIEGINKLPANLVGAANAYLERLNKELVK